MNSTISTQAPSVTPIVKNSSIQHVGELFTQKDWIDAEEIIKAAGYIPDPNLIHQLTVLNNLTNKTNSLSDVLQYQLVADEQISKLASHLICSFRNQIFEREKELFLE